MARKNSNPQTDTGNPFQQGADMNANPDGPGWNPQQPPFPGQQFWGQPPFWGQQPQPPLWGAQAPQGWPQQGQQPNAQQQAWNPYTAQQIPPGWFDPGMFNGGFNGINAFNGAPPAFGPQAQGHGAGIFGWLGNRQMEQFILGVLLGGAAVYILGDPDKRARLMRMVMKLYTGVAGSFEEFKEQIADLKAEVASGQGADAEE